MGALKAGPKAQVSVEPLDFSTYPVDRAERRIRFVETYCLVTKGVGAGLPMVLRPWQQKIVRTAFGVGIRQALVTIPRANGKSALAAALAVAELFVGGESPEVLVVASDQRQANIIYRLARRIVEMNPELADRCLIYKDRLETPHNNGMMTALPADPSALHGWDPSLLLIDEIAQVTPEVHEAVSSVSGKRPESLVLAIGTPADSEDSVMWRMVLHGRSGKDPSFALVEYGAPAGCELDDHDAWHQANPALGDFLSIDGMESVRATLREPVFRQLRLGQWVSGVSSWLPFGAWAKCQTDRAPMPGARITIGFDGSVGGTGADDTVLVAATVEPEPLVWVLGHWANPHQPGTPAAKEWRVPRSEVHQVIGEAFETYDVAAMGCDVSFWRSEFEQWVATYGRERVVEFNWGFRKRQAAALGRFYTAVMEQHIHHDGDEQLAAHMSHAIALPSAQGDTLAKPSRHGRQKIDLVVGAVIAFDLAMATANKPTQPKPRRRRVVTFN